MKGLQSVVSLDSAGAASWPVGTRSCTDIVVAYTLVLAWAVFLALTFGNAGNVSAANLYRPRDFRGDYCGTSSQYWRGQNDFSGHGRLTHTMNVSSAVEDIAKQLVCSTAAEEALRGLLSAQQFQDYACACCKTPCAGCSGVLRLGDLPTPAGLAEALAAKLRDLTDPTRAGQLFAATGANAGAFSGIWTHTNRSFVGVCATECGVTANPGNGTLRRYGYAPPYGVAWRDAWVALAADERDASRPIRETIEGRFVFGALPRDLCPYSEEYCVPFPGIGFVEGAGGWCALAVEPDVAQEVNLALEEAGAQDLSERTRETLGRALGDAMESLDTLALVGVCSLAIGLAFMALLRFFIKPTVWLGIVGVFLLLVVGGWTAHVRARQCLGDSLADSSTRYAKSARDTMWSAVAQGFDDDGAAQETMSGGGADYRGRQARTRSGRRCQRWDSATPHQHVFTSESYPDFDLRENFCRNPSGANRIWCYTTDPATAWEFCDPLGYSASIGTLQCPFGYEVGAANHRQALQFVAYVVFALALLWALLILCVGNRIRLAIAVNEVAGIFVADTPHILCVPLSQTCLALLWCMFWAYCMAFALAQVPEGHVAVGPHTWEEAVGNETEAGRCTESWPPGFAWRYPGDPASALDPCSGKFGNVEGMTPRCWRCAPPRFTVDARVAYSVFFALWQNALIVAIGQCIIAGAVALWFFTPQRLRGKQGGVQDAAYRALRYHIGSLAYGAAVIATAQFVRVCVKFAKKQAELQKNQVAVMVARMLDCCMKCVEEVLKFLSRNAYVQVAVMGTDFCTSARNAFALIVRNAVRFGAVSAVASMVHVVGMGFIWSASALAGFGMLQALHPGLSPIVPMALFIILSHVVADAFMSVFGTAVSATLQCFIAAEEAGLPKAQVPDRLQKLLQNLHKSQRE